MTEELTALGKRLLEAFDNVPGEWLSRSQIAADLERPNNRLNPHDRDILDRLVADGYLETEERLIGTVKTEWVYRVKPKS